MNHVFKLIWNRALGMLVPVPEVVTSPGRGGRRLPRRTRRKLAAQGRMAAAGAIPISLIMFPLPALALPTGGQVVSGQASLATSGSTLNVTQSTQNATIDYQSFNVGANETVNFRQPGASSITLNQVLGSNASAIYGHINANGQVFLVNPNGIYFAPGAQVNVGGLVASTEAISAQDLAKGQVTFSGNSPNSVVNKGTITAAKGGYVAFIGAVVDNEGKIITPNGMTALGAGSSVDLSFSSNSLAHFQVSSAALNAAVKNGGAIIAPNGAVILTAQAKNALLQTVVNNTGIIQAQGVAQNGGVIQLLGGPNGTASNSGTLDASSATGSGGTVTLTGQNVAVGASAKLLATGATGGGTINVGGGAHGGGNVPQAVTTKVAKGAVLNASATANGNGGSITVWSDVLNPASISQAYGTFLAQGGPQGGDGGFIETSGHNVSVTGAVVDTSAPKGAAGTWLLDPYNVTIASSNASGAAFSSNYNPGSNSVILNSSIDTALNVGDNVSITTGTSGQSYGNITVNAPISWSTGNTLQLSASGNIIVNAAISATSTSGTPTLQFFYGSGLGSNSGAGFGYSINAPVNLTSNASFQTRQGGSGSPVNYKVVDTMAALQAIGSGLNGKYVLGANLTDTVTTGPGFTPIGAENSPFTGVLNGLGHTISDLYINRPSSSNIGLFGLADGAAIENIGLLNENVSGSDNTGGLAGFELHGKISNAYATGHVSGAFNVGGLVGSATGTISDAYATAAVSGTNAVGGLAGSNAGTISDAYATGSVIGSVSVGGLVGSNNAGKISFAYATGKVSGNSNVGGLVGANVNGGSITDGYWDKTTTGRATSAGSTNNDGLTTAALAAALPAGFSSAIWGDLGGASAPYLLTPNADQTVLAPGGGEFGGAAGGAAQVTVIQTMPGLEQINALGLGLNYALANNLTYTGTNTGAGFTPIGNSGTNFTGVFDGFGHTISNLYMNRVGGDDTGLFGYVGNNGVVRNVGLLNDNISGRYFVGGLAGGVSGGSLSNAFASGSVSATGGDAGGLAGYTSNASIKGSYASGTVTSGNGVVGGLVGYNYNTTISLSHASGSVSGSTNIGGLVGYNTNGTVTGDYATATVTGTGEDIGGLVGGNYGTVSDSYATGTVSGGSLVGGLVGGNGSSNSKISNSYATGAVSGTSYIGGLVGYNAGSISDAYATGGVTATGGDYAGGLVGSNYGIISNAYATGNVTATGSAPGAGSNAGGLVGVNSTNAKISNAYATGSVSGKTGVGGLVGFDQSNSTIKNVYATGEVSGSNAGGLIGVNNAGTVTDGYWDTATTGQNAGISNSNNANVTGESTVALGAALPAGFSSSVWANAGNQTTPYLIANDSFSTVSGSVILGSDTSTTPTPYNVITSMTQLQDINSTGLGLDYVLGNNLTDTVTTGAGFTPISSNGTSNGAFTGVFDGLGNTISNLYVNRPGSFDIGLFGVVGRAGIIRNIGLIGGSVTGLSKAGALAGSNNGGTISNAYVTTDVSGKITAGGLVGYNRGTISHDYATGSVTGSASVGGLVGYNNGGTISAAYSTAQISGNTNVGGLVGYNTNGGTISNAYATGSVSGINYDVGGLVGFDHGGTISDAYATGSVSGAVNAGGLVGITQTNSKVSNAYATGSVTGTSDVGGLVGLNGSNTKISDAYATGSVSGTNNFGGLVGFNNGMVSNGYWDIATTGQSTSAGSTNNDGLTTAALAAALPAGFSSSVWANAGNQTTPYLIANDAFSTVSGSVILGSDTSATPAQYNVITGMTQLQNINTTGLGLNYVLGTNLADNVTTGAGFTPLGTGGNRFNGSFDGLGHTISNLYIDGSGTYVGLFGLTGGNAIIRNLGLVDANVTGSNYVGGLAGFNIGTISNVYATGQVKGFGEVGGLVGVNSGGVISNAYATATVTATYGEAGGLVGSSGGTINDSYAAGTVNGIADLGGLIGANEGKISNSYATGNVSGTGSNIGGLVGFNAYATNPNAGQISDVYATGNVTGSGKLGGLVGSNSGGTITDGYWDTTTTGQSTSSGSTNNYGLTTAALAAALPTGFSSSVWANAGNQITPYLIANDAFSTVSGSVILGSDASATPARYNVITSMTQLQNITTTGLGLNYVLGNSLNAAGVTGYTPISVGSNSFTGIFDGLNNTISNLSISQSVNRNSGLFGIIGTTGLVENLGLVNGAVTASTSNDGMLAGISAGTIKNDYAAGVAINNSFGTNDSGGLVGDNAGLISNSYATGTVTGGQGADVGGLVGVNQGGGTIANSYATAAAISGGGRFSAAGGLVGLNFDFAGSAIIENSYATGSAAGGLDNGGLVGEDLGGTYSSNYFDTTTSGFGAAAGVGNDATSPTGVTGETTTAVATALPAGFSSSVWANAGGQTTPYLIANDAFSTVSGSVLLGSDTSATPAQYGVITSQTQLENINNALTGDYVLGTSLTASGNFTPIGSSGYQFAGVFDGLGHTISGLNINFVNNRDIGLFGYASTNAIIRNIGLLNVNASGYTTVGGLVGHNVGTVSNAYVTGNVSGGGSNIGGIAGINNGTVKNSYSTATIQAGQSYAGGLVGSNAGGKISNAYATGAVSGGGEIGGLAGSNSHDAVISNAYATGQVSASGSNYNNEILANAGGLVGANTSNSTIKNAYATGQVTASYSNAGGLVGYNSSGTISDAYATGNVSGTGSVGGLVGLNTNSGTVSNGYWDKATTGQTASAGSTNHDGLTTAQLAAALPAGFSSSEWANAGNQITPYLIANDSFNTVSGPVLLGSDTSTTPAQYNVITSMTQLQNINTTGLGLNYVLGQNLNASAVANALPIGGSNGPFTGVFDGLGNVISNLTINQNGDDTGLFGLANNATIRNIGLVNESVTSSNNIGGLVGYDRGSAISNAYATGTVMTDGIGASVGGLVGYLSVTGTINHAYATDKVSGGIHVGGLVGANNGTISNSYATGSVSASISDAGGLVGSNYGGTINNVYATGNVSANDAIGGLIGANSIGTINNAYAAGNVSGSNFAGGLVGANGDGGKISNAYATGNILSTGELVGGLVGSNNGSTIKNAYAAGHVTGTNYTGGLVGYNQSTSVSNAYWDITASGQSAGVGNSNNASVKGETTQALASNLPVGFSSSVWANAGGQTTPYLIANDAFSTVSGSVLLGSDTSTTPKQYNVITGMTQLQNINSTGLGLNYVLGNSLTDTVQTGIGFTPIGSNSNRAFTGVFDGLGNTISNLYINRPGHKFAGLFGVVEPPGVVRDIGLVGASVSGSNYVGGLVGANVGTISAAYVTGRVSGNGYDVGGLAGFNFGTISDAYATGVVSGSNDVGGLVGSNGRGISDAYATGSVAGHSKVGGLVGYNSDGTVSDAYATGSVLGSNYVGGLVGYNSNNRISDAYATGSVTGVSSVGGLVGRNTNFGIVTDGYWDTTTTGQSTSSGSTNNDGLTTAALAAALPAGFSSSVWANAGGQITPYLLANDSFSTVSGSVLLGSDTSSTPKQYNVISSMAQLQDINSTGLGLDYVLGNNLADNVTTGAGFTPIGNSNSPFTGVFDGLYYTINNLYIDRPNSSNIGLFGDTGHALIENIGLENVNIKGGTKNLNAGGLVGTNSGTIRDAYVTGTVSGYAQVGGLVGFNQKGGKISNSYAAATVLGRYSVGGIAGVNRITAAISNAYATGSVSGVNYVGGLIGSNGGAVSDVYAANSVSGSNYVGGLIGSGSGPADGYWDKTATGQATSAGSASSDGLTTAALAAALPTGFSSSVWANAGNQITPYLIANDAFGTVSGSVLLGSDASTTPKQYNVVTSMTQLQNINTTGLGLNYVLGTNLTDTVTTGAGFTPIGNNNAAFNGVFDGLNYTINNLYIDAPSSSNVGLFGKTANALIENIGLVNENVTAGKSQTGGLAGTSFSEIKDAYVTGKVSGYIDVGGLVGFNGAEGLISNAYATASVSGTTNVGGLAGVSSGIISAAYATGNVSGDAAIGGLAGFNVGAISNVYATGSVSGTYEVGGLVGLNSGGPITDGYWDATTTGQSTSSGSTNNYGLTTAQLAGALPTGFSSSVWANAGNQTTPYLIANDSFGTVSGVVLLGSDTSTTPTQYGVITSQTQLENINNGLNGDYVLGTNLTATGNFTPIGSSGYQFGGIFDGLGHTISGLNINFVNNRDIGLFGFTSSNAVIRDIGLLNVNVSGYTTVGGLVGHNAGTISNAYVAGSNSSVAGGGSNIGGIAGINNGTVKNSYATATIQAGQSYAGGLVGSNTGTVSNSYATGNVSGGGEIGGLVGSNSGTIKNSHASGSVVATGYNYSNGFYSGDFVANAGGLAGVNYSGATISNSYATGNVTASASNAGGLAGSNGGGTIKNSYATGMVTITSGSDTGGLVGLNLQGKISNAYATGNVTGIDGVGGLVGYNSNQKILDAYATGAVTGNSNVGGLVGNNGSSATISNAYATGKVTASASYAGGLVGYNSNSTISKAYATGNVSGSNDVGGLVGQDSNGTYNTDYFDKTTSGTGNGLGNGSSASITGLTTAQLAAILPQGFSSNVWANGGNQTTPYLLANASFNTVGGSVYLGTDKGVNGSATPPTPYNVIQTMTQLQNIKSTGLGLNYVLGNSLTDTVQTGIGFTPIGTSNNAFDGVFNGLGYTVNNLYINTPDNDAGLFGIVKNGIIRNVGLTGGSVTGTADVGGLVGYNNGGTISNAYATGSVSGKNQIGGLVGDNGGSISDAYATGSVTSSGNSNAGGLVGANSGSISDAYATGKVMGDLFVGGLVGLNKNGGTISNAYATGSVSGDDAIGGLVGQNAGGNISNAYATGSVSGTDLVGGLAGTNSGTISDAYATGKVIGSLYVGGLVGSNDGTISDAYATGIVSGGDAIGGLVGYNAGTISNAYATGSVSGSSNAGGLVGSNGGTVNNGYWDTATTGQTSSAGGTGLSAAQMLQQSSFTGFDFSTPVWVIYNGHTAPLLAAFLTPITIAASNQSATYNGAASTLGLLNETQTVTGTAPAGTLFGNSGNIFGTNQPYDTAINAGHYLPDLYSDQQGYLISYGNAQLTINPKQLTASIIGTPTKTYNGTNGAVLTPANFSIAGFIAGQGAAVTNLPTSGSYASANIGTDDLVTASLANAIFTGSNGTLLSNYILPVTASGPGTIISGGDVSAQTGVRALSINLGQIVPPNNLLSAPSPVGPVTISLVAGGVNGPGAALFNGSNTAPP